MTNREAAIWLRSALARVQHGWIKHHLIDEGSVCLTGALRYGRTDGLAPEAHVADLIWMAVHETVLEQFPDRQLHACFGVLPYFNDHPDTTQADVELVLEKTALRFEELVD